MSNAPTDCAHDEIVEDSRSADGSIWGRCTGCGDSTFPIRDVAYEKFIEEHGQHRCSLLRMMEGQSYAEALAGSLSGEGCDCLSCRELRTTDT